MNDINPADLGKEMGTVSVSQITSIIKNTLESCFVNLTVTGEISGFKKATSGHIYFTLKDENACISCVLWRTKAFGLDFVPKNGDKVVVHGNVSVYEARGTYQIVCSSLKLCGIGDILAMLEKRKREYEKEGLFDENRKKAIPSRPKKIVIITSGTGAALHDIMNVLKRRNAGIDLLVLPAAVQGNNSSKEIVFRIQEANEFLLGDVIIVGRGGGSLEDLLSFSEDNVVRAISESEIPIISAVGHEIDWALSDYVADLRAPTPSAAAEMVCRESIEEKDKALKLTKAIISSINSKLMEEKLRFSNCNISFSHYIVDNRLSNARMRNESYIESWRTLVLRRFDLQKASFSRIKTELEALSPQKILDRGFSIVTDENKNVISNSKMLSKGAGFEIQFAKGRIKAVCKGVE
ncbi:MAG: exodeoxyribonuclease VII large subunit [Sphaerochaetaceae bacterium]|nr:exodeoxyribonuclease VII large subunit [Sphaerochaetaceae bacterium]